jgi:outer membrane protein insertion porin family
MNKKIFQLLVFCLFFSVNSLAEIIDEIKINGNKRLSNESILVFADVKLGQDYNKDDLNIVLKDLYETNFFKNVTLNIKDRALLINVVENLIIENIFFEGVKDKRIVKMFKEITLLKSRSSYTDVLLSTDLINIKNLLLNTGYYFADVKTSMKTDVENNTINITYNINLGDKAKINKIVFVGDKKFKDRKLSNLIISEEDRFWKFLSANIYLNKEKINLDKRLLENFYKNNGYYNVVIQEAFAEFEKDNFFKLIYNINAGDKYYFNNIKLILPDDFDKKNFSKFYELVNSFKNKRYSLKKIEDLLNEIDKIALQKDYEFIDATVSEKVIDKNKLNFDIIIKETEKYYVEKININGNAFTLEEVIRNSLVVDEGDPYNKILFNKSINKIQSKNIFKTVTPVIREGSSDKFKIIDINVVEKPTGEISLGAGAGTNGATVSSGIKENNFLGKGIKLNTNIAISQSGLKGQFTYEKPNFNYTDNTLITSVSSSTKDNMSDFGFKTSDTSASIGTRFQQYENLFFSPRIQVLSEKLKTTSLASTSLRKQEGNYFSTYFNYSLDLDHRDQSYQTTAGTRYTFFQELPLISNDKVISNSFEVTRYKSMPSDMIAKLSAYGQNIQSISGDDVRISKRAFIPNNKLRGFEQGKVGPTDNSTFIGGNYVASLNASLTMPKLLPTFQNTDFSLFVDAANIWGVDYSSNINDSGKIRSATGLSVDVLTPVGPMNFSWSIPMTKADTDKTESFRFNIGTSF